MQKRSLGKMSGRCKTHIFIISVVLMIVFLVGPPAAYAGKLPKACNIFQEKKAAKLGPCGHDVTFTKDRPFFGEPAVSNDSGSGSLETAFALQKSQLSIFSPPVIVLNSVPLRC
jgi:hypothetical protein